MLSNILSEKQENYFKFITNNFIPNIRKYQISKLEVPLANIEKNIKRLKGEIKNDLIDIDNYIEYTKSDFRKISRLNSSNNEINRFVNELYFRIDDLFKLKKSHRRTNYRLNNRNNNQNHSKNNNRINNNFCDKNDDDTLDVVDYLNNLKYIMQEDLNWEKSIVDLCKLIGISSDLDSRLKYALNLGLKQSIINLIDNNILNDWLHKKLIDTLVQNNGIIPDYITKINNNTK